MDHFEAANPLLFRQRELFNILVSESMLRYRDLRNTVYLTREFDTKEIVVVRNQVWSRRKDRIGKKLLFKTK